METYQWRSNGIDQTWDWVQNGAKAAYEDQWHVQCFFEPSTKIPQSLWSGRVEIGCISWLDVKTSFRTKGKTLYDTIWPCQLLEMSVPSVTLKWTTTKNWLKAPPIMFHRQWWGRFRLPPAKAVDLMTTTKNSVTLIAWKFVSPVTWITTWQNRMQNLETFGSNPLRSRRMEKCGNLKTMEPSSLSMKSLKK